MRPLTKVALVVEFLLGLGPAIYLWSHVTALLPVAISGLLQGIPSAGLLILTSLLGAVGIWGLLQVLIKLLRLRARVHSPRALKVMVGCGVAAVACGYGFFDAPLDRTAIAMLLLPGIVVAHFLFLLRHYLWPAGRDGHHLV